MSGNILLNDVSGLITPQIVGGYLSSTLQLTILFGKSVSLQQLLKIDSFDVNLFLFLEA